MTRNIILFDNYDSFTYNLLHLLKTVKPQYNFEIIRNSDLSIFTKKTDAVIISPGPMRPSDTGILKQYFDKVIVPNKIPVFGVCLGLQFLAWKHNIEVSKSTNPMHGDTTTIKHYNKDIFTNIPSPFKGARYNSLEVNIDKITNNCELKTLAYSTDNNSVMGLRHKTMPWVGVQYHPESFLTQFGNQLLTNFFNLYV